MKPLPVVPEQPVKNLIFGLPTRFEPLTMQPFDFERSKQRFAAGIVPTVPLTAHRPLYAVVAKHLLKRLTGVLAAPVAVKGQPRLWLGTALQPSHVSIP